MFQTTYEFTLPKGYIDEDGNLHRNGIMRLATAADEILPLKDYRVIKNSNYIIIILLSRVITKLGSLQHINPNVIEKLFIEDLQYLEKLYNTINGYDEKITATCPECGKSIEILDNNLGE